MKKAVEDFGDKLEQDKVLLERDAELQQRLVKIHGELNAELEREKELAAKLRKIESELQEAKAAHEGAVRERDRVKRRYIAIEQSRTWRYTFPARKLADLSKRILRLEPVQHQLRGSGRTAPLEPRKTSNIGSIEADVLVQSLHQPAEPVTKTLTPKEKKARRRVERFKRRLYTLGFTDRALADLQSLLDQTNNPYLKRAAAWELALWHANQYNEAGARQCLKLLPKAVQGKNDPLRLRQAAVLEAECHEILGDVKAAKLTISRALTSGPHADLFLAAANLESSLPDRIEWINKALVLHDISEISFSVPAKRPPYDCLIPGRDTRVCGAISADNAPIVSVIIPAYNAEGVIRTALDSVLSQTWTKLDVLVVDDCSTDATVTVVEEYVRKDPRVQFIRAKSNGGPYVARNLALKVAKGEFVTCNDSDDWSHPEKIERQVLHLLKNPSVVGNTSQQARATNDLKFYRRGNPGFYIFSNMSSLMFRSCFALILSIREDLVSV